MLTRMRRDEDGSLVLALAVLMILTTLALAVLARSVTGLTEARRTQDSAAALSAAEAGLADAAVHIGLDPTVDQIGNGALQAAAFDWAAQRVDTAHFRVTSTGTAGAVTRKVAGTISRPSRFPYALFSDQDLAVDGSSIAVADGPVGSNHALTVSSSAGSRQDWFSPAGSCSGCLSGQPGVGPWRVALPDPPAGAIPCPVGGTFTGVVPRGEYVCDDVIFDGPVTLAPGSDPLVLHVSGSALFNGAVVNAGGSAADLQLFVGGGEVRMGEAAAASFVGAIEAPSARLVLGDWQVDVTGAVSIGSVAARPGVHTFRHDGALDDVELGGWSLSDWHQLTNG
jgi:hypothetical protein